MKKSLSLILALVIVLTASVAMAAEGKVLNIQCWNDEFARRMSDHMPGYEAADKLYATLKQFDAVDRAVIGTFHNEITEYLDTTYPDLPRSAGMNEAIEFYLYSLLDLPIKEGKFNFVALQIPTTDYTVNLGTSRMVNYAHKNEIAVQYWTINDAEEMEYLQSIGADAIMTDVPDIGAEVLKQP